MPPSSSFRDRDRDRRRRSSEADHSKRRDRSGDHRRRSPSLRGKRHRSEDSYDSYRRHESHAGGGQQRSSGGGSGVAAQQQVGPYNSGPSRIVQQHVPQQAMPPPLPPPPATTVGFADPDAESMQLYLLMCGNQQDVSLPPGWERIDHGGKTLYLDHIKREAFDEPPWEVWRKRQLIPAAQAPIPARR